MKEAPKKEVRTCYTSNKEIERRINFKIIWKEFQKT